MCVSLARLNWLIPEQVFGQLHPSVLPFPTGCAAGCAASLGALRHVSLFSAGRCREPELSPCRCLPFQACLCAAGRESLPSAAGAPQGSSRGMTGNEPLGEGRDRSTERPCSAATSPFIPVCPWDKSFINSLLRCATAGAARSGSPHRTQKPKATPRDPLASSASSCHTAPPFFPQHLHPSHLPRL